MIGEDKVLHFVISFLIGLVSPVFAAVIGVGKEVWDEARGSMADGADLVADGLGILAALFVRPGPF